MREKFSTLEVATLRNDLLYRGLDCFQIADVIKTFVARHGYGISVEMAHDVASHLDKVECTTEFFQQRLENAALPM